MKSINSKNYNENLFKLENLKGDLDKDVEEILKKFSTYLVNYDEDYLYNYKFIISHIDSFLDAWKKIANLKKYSEKIKKKIIAPDSGLLKIIKVIKQNDNTSLSIKLNDSVEICSENKSNSGYIRIVKNTLPSIHTLKYKDEFDIEITFKFDKIEYRRNYNKVFVREIIEKTNMVIKENSISIIKVLNEILDEFSNDIILKNQLGKIIIYLDNFDYDTYNVSNISLNFGKVFIYNPLKYKEVSNRYSTGTFEYLLKGKSILDIKYCSIVFLIGDEKTKKIIRFMNNQKSIENFKSKFKMTLNKIKS